MTCWLLTLVFQLKLLSEGRNKTLYHVNMSLGSFDAEDVLQNRWGAGVNNILLWKGPPFLSGGPPDLLGSPCPPPEERHLSMPEAGEKGRHYLFKSYTDLE